MKLKLSLVAVFIALAVVACGDDDDNGSASGTSNVSCNDEASKSCSEFRDLPTSGVNAVKDACKNGTVGTACPTENLVGDCASAPAGGVTTVIYYYSGTEADLKTSCESQPNYTWHEP